MKKLLNREKAFALVMEDRLAMSGASSDSGSECSEETTSSASETSAFGQRIDKHSLVVRPKFPTVRDLACNWPAGILNSLRNNGLHVLMCVLVN